MNIQQIRNNTPSCLDKIFLNSAGSSLPPQIITQKIIEYLNEEEKTGGYKLAEMRSEEINDFYLYAAQLLNTNPTNIAFANNATDAYSQALSSIDFNDGDLLITSNDDYVSNYMHFFSLQKRTGIIIEQIRNTDTGDLDLEHFIKLISKKKPKLVAITHIPTNSGLIQDVEAVGEICAAKDILYLVDACQSVGQMPVDIQEIKCDFLSGTGRKFLRGPRGTGFLYVSDKALNKELAPLYVDLRGATWSAKENYYLEKTARRFERWEIPYALLIGLKEAIKYALQTGLENIRDYNKELCSSFRAKLLNIDGVTLYDKGTKKSSIITFRKNNKELKKIIDDLSRNNIYFSIVNKDSAFIDFEKKGIDWAIRFSPHYFNTNEETERACNIVRSL